MKNNVILIGMPASGKSTAGVVLAKLLGYDFIDTDLLIQHREGRRLSEIIESRGIDGFIAVEEEVCASLQTCRSVIATGGSAVYSRPAMTHLKRLGCVIYLETEYAVLQNRLSNIRDRGVVLRPGQSIEQLYAERVPLYRRYADIIVPEEDGSTLEETVQAAYRQYIDRNVDPAP